MNRLEERAAAQAEHHQMIDALQRRDADALHGVLERHSTRALFVGYAEDEGAGDEGTTGSRRRRGRSRRGSSEGPDRLELPSAHVS